MMAQHWLTITPNRAARIAGIGLVLMTLLAMYAEFGVRQSLVVPGDVVTTADNILAHTVKFRLAIAAYLIVAVLDVIVAWGLYVLLSGTNRPLSQLTAWLRIVYATMLGSLLVHFTNVLHLLSGKTPYTYLTPDIQLAQVMLSLDAFDDGWMIALIVFGLHLVLLGVLVYESVDFPKWLGVLVGIAGLGYINDGLHRLFAPDCTDMMIAQYTFVGEVLLMLWLLFRRYESEPVT